jgi:hypothetical protein
MAKLVILTHQGTNSSFQPIKIERAKVYGAKKRIALDASGKECTKVALTADGQHLLKSGCTAQGYFTASGNLVSRSDMVGIDAEGNIVQIKPSTLGAPQALIGPVDPINLLSLAIQSVYYLDPVEVDLDLAQTLQAGDIYQCPFNFSAGLEIETAYILSNAEGYFALVGKPMDTRWIEQGEVFVTAEDEELGEDELDFESM